MNQAVLWSAGVSDPQAYRPACISPAPVPPAPVPAAAGLNRAPVPASVQAPAPVPAGRPLIDTWFISTTVVVEPLQSFPQRHGPLRPTAGTTATTGVFSTSAMMNTHLMYPHPHSHHFQKWSNHAASSGLLHNTMSIGPGLAASAHDSSIPFLHNEVRIRRLPMSMQTTWGSQNHNPHNQTFHTPSFGDEDFNIPPISLSVTDPVSQAHSTLYSSQLLSHHLPDGNINGTQPLSHHPGTTVAGGYSQSQALPHHGNIAQPHSQQSQHNHNVNFFTPKFPPQNIDIPDISASNYNHVPNSQPQQIYAFSAATTNNGYQQHQGLYQHSQNSIVRSLSATTTLPREPILTTIGQQQLGSDIGRPVTANQSGKAAMDGRQVSPPGSTNTSPGRESSEDSDDSLPLAQLAMKRTAPEEPTPPPPSGASAGKKSKTPKKRKKKDPNEPQKPVSAYALFFRDTQAAIKGQNPNASFGEVSKIVASMWDNLDADQKSDYKKKTETAKKEYLKQLAAYRATLVSKQSLDPMDPYADKASHNMIPQKGMITNSMPNVMPAMASPNPAHATHPAHLGHMTDSHMMPSPHQQPMGGMQQQQQQQQQSMAVHQQQHQQGGMPSMVQHHPPGMPSPQGPMGSPMHMNNQGQTYGMDSPPMSSQGSGRCIRNGCQNHAISNPAWDNEYCSNDCVVSHCRDVFTAWVAARQNSNSYASVK